MDVEELQAFVAESRRRELELLDIISRQEWKESGYRHLWQFLMDVLRVSASEAKRLQHHVELLCPKVGITGQPLEPKLPAVRAAMTEGGISAEHVHRIDKVIGKVPEQVAEQVEQELVEAAYQFNPTELAKLGEHLINTLDPDGPEPADASVVEGQNELDLRHHEDGSLTGRFHLGAESAALVKTLLSPLTTPRPGDDRTLVERQGDALAEIIGFAADSGKAPMEGGERPHIAVTVSLETLQTGIGTATLDDGRSLTPEQTRRLACDAGIIPIVLGSKSQPLDIGESKRLASKRQRQALAIRDKGCAAPGCARTPHQCHAHHVQHWADGGPTTLANMVLVCHYHHRLIHHAGWQVHMDNGLPVFTPPAWLRRAA